MICPGPFEPRPINNNDEALTPRSANTGYLACGKIRAKATVSWNCVENTISCWAGLTTRRTLEGQDSKSKAQYGANRAKMAHFAYLYDLARAVSCSCVIRRRFMCRFTGVRFPPCASKTSKTTRKRSSSGEEPQARLIARANEVADLNPTAKHSSLIASEG